MLGVSINASKDEIRKAYRNLARKYHPDSNQGNKAAEEKFKEINDAYTILSDETKRANYNAKESQKINNDTKFQSGKYQKSRQSKTNQQSSQKSNSTSNQAKQEFHTDRESIYRQFNNFFGIKM